MDLDIKQDLDNYINNLIKEIEFLKKSNILLKQEIKIQHQEISRLKEEKLENNISKCI